MADHVKPADIERTSMGIITAELAEMGILLPEDVAPVVKRAIHTSADFDYAQNLHFTKDAVRRGTEAFLKGTTVFTDTNMAKAGISSMGLAKLGSTKECYMADSEIIAAAKAAGTTRAVAAMNKITAEYPGAILAVGNAPTALFEIARHMREDHYRPSLVIAVPVGFVNVVEAKEEIFHLCEELDVPCIAAFGRKGGSNVAAAICNALIYSATDMLDPTNRGWN